jgi:hypothetical protein
MSNRAAPLARFPPQANLISLECVTYKTVGCVSVGTHKHNGRLKPHAHRVWAEQCHRNSNSGHLEEAMWLYSSWFTHLMTGCPCLHKASNYLTPKRIRAPWNFDCSLTFKGTNILLSSPPRSLAGCLCFLPQCTLVENRLWHHVLEDQVSVSVSMRSGECEKHERVREREREIVREVNCEQARTGRCMHL